VSLQRRAQQNSAKHTAEPLSLSRVYVYRRGHEIWVKIKL